jgi:flagella basal body P-ring formation protein FlgA
VDVEWADQNVSLTLRGIATRNAGLGERVPVRTGFGHRVDGTVIAPGRVRID